MKHQIKGQEICLLPQKALFWPSQEMLIVADIHLGKAGHFRRAGIALPDTSHQRDLDNLEEALRQSGARHLLFLGDLFHSLPNQEWKVFEQWLRHWLQSDSRNRATLVVGNHDLHGKEDFPQDLFCCPQYASPPFLFTHEPLPKERIPEGMYNLSGHLHPAILFKGLGKQKLKLPCFYFGKQQGYLPAFGKLTGLMVIYPDGHEDVFVIAEEKVLSW